MSEVNFEELQVIAGFLQTIQGQGIQVLVELATTPGLPAAVRLNAALALTGMYDQFMLDVAEGFGPEVVDDPGWVDEPLPAETYEQRLPDEYDPTAWAAEESQRSVGTIHDEQTLAQLQALGLDASEVMQPATEENLAAIEERLARQQVEAAQEVGDESLGGASGIGPRNPKASRRRRKHGRR